jgi:aminoglycoside 3-N-acetyltransferase
MPTEREVIERSRGPLSVADLVTDLAALGIEPGRPLIAHVSLSSLGWVAGGAQAAVEALLAAVGPSGTLVMASQSAQLSDPSYWSEPPVPGAWVESVKAIMPAYDPYLTPARGMGAVVACLLQSRATLRSPHPIYSFCARGPAAGHIVAEHPLSPSFGDRSPLAKLYAADAQILLLGVGHESNTSLHFAEHRASWPGRRMYRSGAPLEVDGSTQWVTFQDLVVSTGDFPAIATAFSDTGGLRIGTVGAATAQLMSMRAIVDFGLRWISRYRR